MEAEIASLESRIESLSKDNEALAAENRRLAEDASRAAAEAARVAAEKQAAIDEKDRAYAQLKSEHDKLVEMIKMANARHFGAKSERVLPHQLSMFNDAEASAPAPAAGKPARPPRPRKPKRKVDWASFETTVETHELPEGGRACPACDHAMDPMGYEVKREFVYVPARIEVREHRVAKYVCPTCSAANAESGGEAPATIVQAPGPALPLPGTWASASLLAHVMRQKYELALPIYRISGDLSSQQRLPVSRQTLSGWVIDAYGRWLARLYSLIRGEVLSRDIVHCDETPVQVLKEPKRKPQSKSYMWLFASAACDRDAYVFEYHPTRGKAVVESFLDGWSGTIVTDGYAAYENLGPDVRRVSCIVHIRRGFYKIVKDVGVDAAEASGSVALEALRRIEAIVAADNALDGLGADERKARRNAELRPMMEGFREWAIAQRDGYAAKKMKLYEALSYAIDQWPALMNALDDGRLPIDNNRAEQAIRPFAVGRKNWLFSDTQAGAHASAGIYSVVTTARANGLKAFDYLEWVLSEMPKAEAAGDLDAARFLPWSPDVPERCRASREKAEAVFRDEPIVDVDVDEYEEIVG